MTTGTQRLLCEMLSCGTADLETLDCIGYGWGDILSQLDDIPIQEVGFNGLMRAVVDYGIVQIKEAIDLRICELEAIPNERELDTDEEHELAALSVLNPDEDIRGYYNFLDTHVWFEHNGSVYRVYMQEAIDDFEDNTGFSFSEFGGDGE